MTPRDTSGIGRGIPRRPRVRSTATICPRTSMCVRAPSAGWTSTLRITRYSEALRASGMLSSNREMRRSSANGSASPRCVTIRTNWPETKPLERRS
jgi:hypothetical protein